MDGPVFRLVKGVPEDWQSHLQRDIQDDPDVSDCHRAALSCSRTLEDIKELQSAIPWLRRRRIARADLEPKHGKILETGGAGHHSLWLKAQYHQNCGTLFVTVPDE